jgi:lipopolysaccharide export system protein LptA
VKAETAIWKKSEKKLVLKGDVCLERGSITLKAPEVVLFGDIDNPYLITASGKVYVEDKKREAKIEAERIEVFLKERRAKAFGSVKIDYRGRRVWAEEAVYGPEDKVVLSRACKLSDERGSFSAESIIYFITEDRIQLKGNVKGALRLRE